MFLGVRHAFLPLWSRNPRRTPKNLWEATVYAKKKKLSHLQTPFSQAPAGCSLGIGDRRILVYHACSGKRSVTCDYFILRLGPLSKYSPVMLHLSPATRILHKNPVPDAISPCLLIFYIPRILCQSVFYNNEVKIVVFIGLFMLESFSFIFNFER